HYRTRKSVLKAVDHVGFSLRKGEKFGLVGESGSGKSTLVLAMLRLIKPPGEIAGGEVYLDGVDLMKLSEEEMRHTRLSDIALIPQAAMNALNPVIRIKQQFRLAMRDHGENGSDWESRVVELLDW